VTWQKEGKCSGRYRSFPAGRRNLSRQEGGICSRR
jgi:hypothetical protein